jgi:hypothetical protein
LARLNPRVTATASPPADRQAFVAVPGWLLQTPEQVARAIPRCVRRPHAEVWPFPPVRALAGLVDLAAKLRLTGGVRYDQGRKSMYESGKNASDSGCSVVT